MLSSTSPGLLTLCSLTKDTVSLIHRVLDCFSGRLGLRCPDLKRATVPGNLNQGRQHFRRGGNLFYVTRFGPHLALLGLAHGCAEAGHTSAQDRLP